MFTEYIYFVKCPECEDEPFSFFDEAKTWALGRLSEKPVITQIEVCRNDFGECTSSCDLGTVWSWEDVMSDISHTNDETLNTLTKKDLVKYNPYNDSELTDVHFALDDIPDNFRNPLKESGEVLATNTKGDYLVRADSGHGYTVFNRNNVAIGGLFNDDVNGDDQVAIKRFNAGDIHESCERKAIPEGMTIEQLVEAMEENEDTVECAWCEEIFPKEDCRHDDKHGWICDECDDALVECTWCEELYDRSECRKEVNLGWLCSRCEAAIKSRGETLTFKESSYWDYLDESTRKPITWECEFDGHYVGEVTASSRQEALEAMMNKYPEYPYGLYDGCYEVFPEEGYEHYLDY